MLKTMLELGKIHFKEYSIYKSNFYLFTLNRIVEVIVYIFVWQAIYMQTGNTGEFTIEQMITYYILVVSLSSIATWGINEDMAHSIRTGKINKELLSPMSYFKYYFGINLGEIGFAIPVSIATFILCAIFWKVIMPVSIMNFVLFLLVIGLIAPLTLFPEWFQKIANILPFKEFIYTPINIYLGTIPLNEIGAIILKLVLWIAILYLIAKIFFEHAVKKITINGG